MRHVFRLLTLPAVLALGACGTMAEGQTQDVTLHTPGASEARCILDNGLRYPIRTGETVQIMRSFHAMEIDCYAIGNRHKTMTISPGPNPWSAANVANGVVPGTAYDAASMGLYTYPDVITVDFTGVPTQGYETPNYHNKDVQNPYETAIENMGPTTIRGPAGSNEYLPRGIEKRDMLLNNNPFTHLGGNAATGASAPANAGVPAMTPSTPNAGALSGRTAEELTRSANPSVFNQ